MLSSLTNALISFGMHPSIVKVDCLWTEDDKRLSRLGVPVKAALSKDMCPDHFAIYNTEDMISWARDNGSDILLNETAGLCLRCAPYPNDCLAVCVIDITSGPNNPLKVGPLMTSADVVMMTKAEIVSRSKDVSSDMRLRNNPPFSICTLCAGETRIGKEHQRGVLRRMDGFTDYRGE